MKRRISLVVLSMLMILSFFGCTTNDLTEKKTQYNYENESGTGDFAGQIQSSIQDSLEDLQTPSMEKLLRTSILPLGSTLYVWGGGWNEDDTEAGVEAVTMGISPAWKRFYEKMDATYDYNNTRYQIHDGLDCSGYIGWLIYNTLNTKSGNEGYVTKATLMAQTLAGRGYGKYKSADMVDDFKTGDIMSTASHVWMVLGTCSDGSVLLIHCSPPGVRLSGTALADGKESEAVRLAREYTSRYYPEWHERYPYYSVERSLLTDSAQMRWNSEFLKDADTFRNMDVKSLLKWLFKES